MENAVNKYEAFETAKKKDDVENACAAAREFLTAIEMIRSAPAEAVLVSNLGEHVGGIWSDASWQQEKETEAREYLDQMRPQ
jgi:hypothetical protein